MAMIFIFVILMMWHVYEDTCDIAKYTILFQLLTKKLYTYQKVTIMQRILLMEKDQHKALKTGIKYGGKTYYCSLELIGGKWKTMMLYHLRNGPLRSSELQRRMRDISGKMFTQTARALEKNGLIVRTIFPVIPPKVEYSLSSLGMSAIPVIMDMGYWGESISDDKSG